MARVSVGKTGSPQNSEGFKSAPGECSWRSSGASGGCLHGVASSKVEKAHFAA